MPIVPRQVGSTYSATGTIAVAYPVNVVAGNLLYCAIRMEAGNSIATITDSQGNSWAQVAAAIVTTYRFYLYKVLAGASGANTVTVTTNIASVTTVYAGEVSGMGASLTNGPSNSLDVTSSEAPLRAATLAVTQVGIVIAHLVVDGSPLLSAAQGPIWVDGLLGNAGGPWVDLGNAGSLSSARAAVGILSGASVTVEPKFNLNSAAPRSGESMTAAIYGEASSGDTIVVATQSPILAPPRSMLGY